MQLWGVFWTPFLQFGHPIWMTNYKISSKFEHPFTKSCPKPPRWWHCTYVNSILYLPLVWLYNCVHSILWIDHWLITYMYKCINILKWLADITVDWQLVAPLYGGIALCVICTQPLRINQNEIDHLSSYLASSLTSSRKPESLVKCLMGGCWNTLIDP